MNTGIRHSLAVDLGAPRTPRDGEIWVDGEWKWRRYDMVSARWHLSSEFGSSTDDPVSPSHYQGFSNGAEVIDITENLNSNGGQAVQYIARSTRLDGRNKGNPIEDLKKAAFFIQRELARQEGNQ